MSERSASYKESVRLTRELHVLIARGEGDSPEADALRDQLDDPWPRMSPDEREILRVLSADLYTLWKQPHALAEITLGLEREFESLIGRKQWVEALWLLQRAPALAGPALAAILRAQGWNWLGEPEVADDFLLLARRLAGQGAPPPRRTVRVRQSPVASLSLPHFQTVEARS